MVLSFVTVNSQSKIFFFHLPQSHSHQPPADQDCSRPLDLAQIFVTSMAYRKNLPDDVMTFCTKSSKQEENPG